MAGARQFPKSSEPSEPPKRRRPAAKTPEAREQQLVSLAYDLAEKQLAEGTASAQVITHYLKIGSTREQLELEELRQKTKLLDAKIEDINNAQDMKQLYAEAMSAFAGYSGNPHLTGPSSEEEYYEG
jgi:phage repressor protein C with HTH and peptisase S24 domain